VDDHQAEHLVDLDAVAAELQARRAQWESRGLEITAFTWRDAQAPWPKPIVADRALVTHPESLGMTMDAAPNRTPWPQRYAKLVLWCYGHADLDAIIDDQEVCIVPRYQHITECVAVAESLVERLLSGAEPERPISH
jgi:hypothetical protein